jgi:hypothetical protein
MIVRFVWYKYTTLLLAMQIFPANKKNNYNGFRYLMYKDCHLLQNDPAVVQKFFDIVGIS